MGVSRLQIGRPAVVVGTSIGGAAALDFALTHPEDVAALVLIDAQGFIDGDPAPSPLFPSVTLPNKAHHPSGHQGTHAHQTIPLRIHLCVATPCMQLATTAAINDDWDMVLSPLLEGPHLERDRHTSGLPAAQGDVIMTCPARYVC